MPGSTLNLPDSLDACVERDMRERRIPGLALAIARNGTLLLAHGYGLVDVQNEGRATGEHGKVTSFAVTALGSDVPEVHYVRVRE